MLAEELQKFDELLGNARAELKAAKEGGDDEKISFASTLFF